MSVVGSTGDRHHRVGPMREQQSMQRSYADRDVAVHCDVAAWTYRACVLWEGAGCRLIGRLPLHAVGDGSKTGLH